MLKAILLSLGLALAASSVLADEPIWLFGESDPVMNQAIEGARAHLSFFLDYATPDRLLSGNVMVKYAAPVVGKTIQVEHIWVAVEQIDGDQITGIIANEPYDLDAKQGDRIDFEMSQVSDWSYWGTDGKLYGNYTTRVMLPQLSAEDQVYFQGVLAPLPD